MLINRTLLTIALFSSGQAFANIPIENRSLSQNTPSYNSATSSPTTNVSNNPSWELLQQNQRLENQIRELRGKIEEQDHQIDQLNRELTNRYTDLDQRLELLQQKIDPAEEESVDPNTTPSDTPTQPANDNSNPSSTTAEPSPPLASNTPPPTPPEATTTSNNQAELDKAAYTVALEAYKQGGAKKAIAPMQNFVKNNPNSVYTGNAYFWLAEFNLAIEPPNYEEAKKNYETVAAKFPQSSKAARSLYQLYSIAKDVNKNTQTAEVYKSKLLSSYPQSEEASFFKNS